MRFGPSPGSAVTTYHVGVSGWRYDSWRGDFYPAGLPRRAELAHLAARTTAVEVNGSFYGLLRPAWYAARRDETPDDFVFALKGSRYITHMKRLRDVDTALANFFASGPLELGDKLGPILWQLPARFAFDADRLGSFLERLPRTTGEAARIARHHDDRVPDPSTADPVDRPLRHVLEPRHESFGADEALDLLRAHEVSLVTSDGAGTWPVFDEDTGPLRYARLHGHTRLYASGYSASSLDGWARRCGTWAAAGRDVHVYFDNDAEGRAPHDAVALLDRLGVPVPPDGTP